MRAWPAEGTSQLHGLVCELIDSGVHAFPPSGCKVRQLESTATIRQIDCRRCNNRKSPSTVPAIIIFITRRKLLLERRTIAQGGKSRQNLLHSNCSAHHTKANITWRRKPLGQFLILWLIGAPAQRNAQPVFAHSPFRDITTQIKQQLFFPNAFETANRF